MCSFIKKMKKTSRALSRINRNAVRNLLIAILDFDIWLFVTVEYYISKIIRFLKPILEVLFIMSFGAGLLLAYGSVYIMHHESYDDSHLHGNVKYSRDELLAIADTSDSYRSLIHRELIKLKRKSHHFERSLQKMNAQLHDICQRKKSSEILPDFASETVGGSIVSIPNTETFYETGVQATVFGIPVWQTYYHTPRTILQPWSEAGECWAFRGSRGSAVIQLAQLAVVDSVTLEHIAVSASLTGSITSAPREFRIMGEFRNKYLHLGSFVYKYHGPSSQTFKITKHDMKNIPLKLIMLQVVSNWGHPEYTCIYRFKVHGKMYN